MKSRSTFRVWGGCLLALLVMQVAQADVWTASVNGYWTNATTWGGGGTPGNNDDAVINSGVSVTVDVSTASLNSLTNNGTLMFMGWSTVVSATVVQVNGTITHAINTDTNAPWIPDNRIYLACSNLTVAGSGTINANGCGYQGSVVNESIGYGPGASTVGKRMGAAYGGLAGGASYSVMYGNAAAPEDPGSGGSGGGDGYPGGSGGGVIRILASGVVSNAGTISADGKWFKPYAGGGSGGSVYITCMTLTGAGTVSAIGSSTSETGSGGGGGRIAVSYNTTAQAVLPRPAMAFRASGGKWTVSGAGATFPNCGKIGTLHLSDGVLLPSEFSDASKIRDVSILGFGAWATPSLTISNTSIGFSQSDFELAVTNGGLLLTNSAYLYTKSVPANGIKPYTMRLSISGDMTVSTNCWVFPTADLTNGGSVKFVMNNLTVALGGGINADGLGYAGTTNLNTNGFGPGGGGYTGDRGGGGGYGGRGGRAGYEGGASYGDSNAPVQPGSGGGNGNNTMNYTRPGAGGGLVWAEARGIITLIGSISANGQPALAGYGAGGSGGGIYLTCKSITGAGPLSAAGGGGGTTASTRGGGGGRIAVWSANNTWSGSPSVAGGVGLSYSGESGTLVLGKLAPTGTLILVW